MIRTTLGLFLGVWPVLTLGSLSLWVAPDEVTHLLGNLMIFYQNIG